MGPIAEEIGRSLISTASILARRSRWERAGGQFKARGIRAALIALILMAVGCDVSSSPGARGSFRASGSKPIEVVCSTGMVGEVVERVGGDRVRAFTLMGEGVDPHLYKPSPGDVLALSRAEMIVFSGLHLEGKMGKVFERLGRSKPAVAVAEWIGTETLLKTTGGQVDPHVWFDLTLWAEAVEGARVALSEFDPEHSALYASNAERYREEMARIDTEVRERIATIPEARRVLVTAHDAFGYFGRAYGMEVLAIQGLSTESEAGVREINALVDLLVDRRIPAVFVEASISDRNIQALVEGCAARGHRVRIGGELFSDSMGEAGTPEGTYLGMVRHNVATIAKALQ